MILGFDIGNSSTTGAVYENGASPVTVFRYATDASIGADEIALAVDARLKEAGAAAPVEGFAFASVVPALEQTYREVARRRFGLDAVCADHTSRLSFSINYDDPAELGPDRIVNAEAAYREYGGGVVVVDAGTAVTFCVMLEGGVFDGGIIVPGPGTAAWAMAERAARLPEVPFERPGRVAARSTRAALQSGFFHGWHCLIDGLIARIEGEYGRAFGVVLTGGYASRLTLAHTVTVDELLTMKGIRYVYDLNRRI